MPANSSQIRRNAEKYLSAGKVIAAIAEYRKLVSWDPTDLNTLNVLGDLYVRAGHTEEAAQAFTTVANGYNHHGFTSKTIAVLKKLLRIDPGCLEAATKLAECYALQGQRLEAVRQYLAVAKAHEDEGRQRQSLVAYCRASEIDPLNASLQMTVGEKLLSEGSRRLAHRSFVAAAAEFSRQGDDDRALAAYLKAREIEPDHRGTLVALSAILSARGEADRAIPILLDSLARHSGDTDLQRVLGAAYLAAGRLDEAHRTFLGLIELDAATYSDLLAVGERLLEIGHLDRAAELTDGLLELMLARREEQGAVDLLRKILDRDPTHPGALRRLASIFRRLREDFNLIPTLDSLARSAVERGDRDEAIETLRELSELEPYEKRHRRQLKELGYNTGAAAGNESAAARNNLELVTSKEPAVMVLPTPARLGRVSGNTENAISELRRIIVGDPDNIEARIALKDTYTTAGMMDLAANECLQIGRIRYSSRKAALAQFSLETSDEFQEAMNLSPRLAAGLATGPVVDFPFFSEDNRRRAVRKNVRLPLVVISRDGEWCEFTRTLDVSDIGVRLMLTHTVLPDTTLRIGPDGTKWPEAFAQLRDTGAQAIVRHIHRTKGGANLVGIEFGRMLAAIGPGGCL